MLKPPLIFTTMLLAAVFTLTSCNRQESSSYPTEEQVSLEKNLVYKGLVKQEVLVASFLSGTNIKYLGLTEDDSAEVNIDGQRALKRRGDSLDWQGSPLEGVTVALNQRLIILSKEKLQLGGNLRMEVEDVVPKPGLVPQAPDEPSLNLVVYKVPVLYWVKVGEEIPGTTFTYVGKTEKGAELSGLPEGDLPYRQTGDSVTWKGQLRPKVYLDLALRTTLYNEKRLNVSGLATIILATGDQSLNTRLETTTASH
ncbi:MAG: hypothetical protein F6J89_10095 [Symploca sp. SIO1C4]|uniref:Uncharacterized protein n=1 Tax=Symploca sp. SIO1C4 TaxID=2607765 RepID=A0A6B3N8L0_9CYAN|nr:hypothetical protein [Symploca sp. SIO1C4]